MDKLIFLIIILMITSCFSNENKVQSEVDKTSILFDTLFFHKNMNGEILDKKFEDGKEKFSFYKEFIILEKIDSLQVITEKHSKTETKYLGKLIDLKKDDAYHIITNFKIIGIGKMSSPRGKSEVAFINTKDDSIITYDLGMPDNLPISINDNVLYFVLNDIKTGISISGGLPPMICLPVINCH